jgi:hypothetical protein
VYNLYYGVGPVGGMTYPMLKDTWSQIVPGSSPPVPYWKLGVLSERTQMSKYVKLAVEADKWVRNPATLGVTVGVQAMLNYFYTEVDKKPLPSGGAPSKYSRTKLYEALTRRGNPLGTWPVSVR